MTNEKIITVNGIVYAVPPAHRKFAAYPMSHTGQGFAEIIARRTGGVCVNTGDGYAVRVAGWELGVRGTKRPVPST